jgi:hypothetical protein
MLHETTETEFEEKGSLAAPGPVGRLVRLALGVWLLSMVYTMVADGGYLIDNGLALNSNNLLSLAILFWVFPYVINIGWGLNSGRRGQIAIITLSIFLATFDYMAGGIIYGQALKLFTLLWLFYTVLHLGASMTLAAVIATPGCEMRSLPQLWGIITRSQAKEHYCPGFLNGLDRWERGRDSSSKKQK